MPCRAGMKRDAAHSRTCCPSARSASLRLALEPEPAVSPARFIRATVLLWRGSSVLRNGGWESSSGGPSYHQGGQDPVLTMAIPHTPTERVVATAGPIEHSMDTSGKKGHL